MRHVKRVQQDRRKFLKWTLADPGLKQITELRWNERTVFRCAKGDLQIEAVVLL